MKTIKICHLYYDLMNLYGENGNVRFLEKKLKEQGLKVNIDKLSIGDKIDYKKYDIYYIGMGSEDSRRIVLNDMIKQKDEIVASIKSKKFFLATGNSIDLFGKTITDGDNKWNGLGAFNYNVTILDNRIVGEQYYETKCVTHDVIGFQNRSSLMDVCDNKLFDVIKGNGYNNATRIEGVFKYNFYGTYLLGPILVRNPFFTDYFVYELLKSLDIKYTETSNDDVSYKAYFEYIKNFHEKI